MCISSHAHMKMKSCYILPEWHSCPHCYACVWAMGKEHSRGFSTLKNIPTSQHWRYVHYKSHRCLSFQPGWIHLSREYFIAVRSRLFPRLWILLNGFCFLFSSSASRVYVLFYSPPKMLKIPLQEWTGECLCLICWNIKQVSQIFSFMKLSFSFLSSCNTPLGISLYWLRFQAVVSGTNKKSITCIAITRRFNS